MVHCFLVFFLFVCLEVSENLDLHATCQTIKGPSCQYFFKMQVTCYTAKWMRQCSKYFSSPLCSLWAACQRIYRQAEKGAQRRTPCTEHVKHSSHLAAHAAVSLSWCRQLCTFFSPKLLMYRVALLARFFSSVLAPLGTWDNVTIFFKVCGTGATHYLVMDTAASVCLSF